jgi:hypothetical protein
VTISRIFMLGIAPVTGHLALHRSRDAQFTHQVHDIVTVTQSVPIKTLAPFLISSQALIERAPVRAHGTVNRIGSGCRQDIQFMIVDI